MTSLTAPRRMGRRSEARALVDAELPVAVEQLRITFPPGAATTPSFLDELLAAIVVEDRAKELVLVGLSADSRRLVRASAGDLGVTDRVSFE